jgi:hypothetical protein
MSTGSASPHRPRSTSGATVESIGSGSLTIVQCMTEWERVLQ